MATRANVKRLCRICHVREATLPDRYYAPSLIPRICHECHAIRLVEDLRRLLKEYE